MIEIDRQNLRLLASGKYLELNKSYDQQQHQQFVDGALFTYDHITKQERDLKLNKPLGGTNEPMVTETLD